MLSSSLSRFARCSRGMLGQTSSWPRAVAAKWVQAAAPRWPPTGSGLWAGPYVREIVCKRPGLLSLPHSVSFYAPP